MKAIVLSKCLVFVAFFTIGVGLANSQGGRDTSNVEDYYLRLVKQQGLPLLNADWNKSSKIIIKDTKNGYLKIEGPIEGWVEVALFRKKNKTPVLVVGVTGCGPACGTELHAFEPRGGSLENEVSKRLKSGIESGWLYTRKMKEYPVRRSVCRIYLSKNFAMPF